MATEDCSECRRLGDLSTVAAALHSRASCSLGLALQCEPVDLEEVDRLKAVVRRLKVEREEADEEYRRHLLTHPKSMTAGSSADRR